MSSELETSKVNEQFPLQIIVFHRKKVVFDCFDLSPEFATDLDLRLCASKDGSVAICRCDANSRIRFFSPLIVFSSSAKPEDSSIIFRKSSLNIQLHQLLFWIEN